MKRGKKYTEAAKLVDRTKQYEVEEAVSLVKLTLDLVLMDVMQISRSVVPLYYHMVQVKRLEFLYLLRATRLMKH